jgi:hypothetical protein
LRRAGFTVPRTTLAVTPSAEGSGDHRAARGAFQAVRHLTDQGHCRLGDLGDRDDIWAVRGRYAGCADAGLALTRRATAIRPDRRDTSPAREVVLLTRLVIRGSGEIAPIAT